MSCVFDQDGRGGESLRNASVEATKCVEHTSMAQVKYKVAR